MEIGIDSFADKKEGDDNVRAINNVIDRIVHADKAGLHVFGIGEHHRKEFLDSAPFMILSAAAARTKNIRLTSAVTVLSAADPVRVFQNLSTLDLVSGGRAEMVAGRGSFSEAFPLFGFDFQDYDALFKEKLNLILQIRDNEIVNWKGQFRAALENQTIYPRPVQKPLPIWLGVGGTPESFVRAGTLGLPLMLAIIGGQTNRFRSLVNLYREAWEHAGHPKDKCKVGIHSLGYVANTKEEAIEIYYEGYSKMFTKIGKERGWPPVTREHFDSQIGPKGAIVLGGPEEVAEKILRHSEALGGITRFQFQMDTTDITHENLIKSIDLIGKEVIPRVNK
ncbi:MAG: LLM class flavin-dependent oxidoreductase [Pelagibacteraceae bacterium]|nr:LLM class flavin-dependent oxidoreductase [Pelagibacteraceae bacterium]